jgi:hypothetical protein
MIEHFTFDKINQLDNKSDDTHFVKFIYTATDSNFSVHHNPLCMPTKQKRERKKKKPHTHNFFLRIR